MKPPPHSSAAQLRELIDLLGEPTQDDVAKKLGVRREYISRILGGHEPSDQFQKQIGAEIQLAKLMRAGGKGAGLEVAGPPEDDSMRVEEPPGDYRISGSLEHRAPSPLRPASPKMIDPDPRFQGPLSAEPTPQKCAEYFKEYLRRAATEPGGIGYAWVKLQKLFPLDEFEGRKKSS